MRPFKTPSPESIGRAAYYHPRAHSQFGAQCLLEGLGESSRKTAARPVTTYLQRRSDHSATFPAAVQSAATEAAPLHPTEARETHSLRESLSPRQQTPESERNGRLYLPPDPTTASTGMAVTWLGTSSGAPTRRRNVSGIAFRTSKQTILVDCGEATNRQLTVAGIHPLSVTNIFITHMHGDHCFGLMGLLTVISEARASTALAQKALRVFGPPGIQHLVSTAMNFTRVRLAMPLVVAEFTVEPRQGSAPQPVPTLQGVAFARLAPDFTESAQQAVARRTRRSDLQGVHEIDVVDGLTWTIPCEHGLTVKAAQLQHRVPCWGYVMQEADQAPAERADRLQEAGLAQGDALALLQAGRHPAGLVQTPLRGAIPLRDLLIPPRPGRKVVLLGDTCDSRAITEAARGADLLSHEATFSSNMSAKAYKAQHSTAAMAGAFARSIDASALVLTHFSGRYAVHRGRGSQAGLNQDSQDASVGDIWSLLQEARKVFRGQVYPAQDFFTFEVWDREQQSKQRNRRSPSTQEETAGLILEADSVPAATSERPPLRSSEGHRAQLTGARSRGVRDGGTRGRGSGGRGRHQLTRESSNAHPSSSQIAQQRRGESVRNGGHDFAEVDF